MNFLVFRCLAKVAIICTIEKTEDKLQQVGKIGKLQQSCAFLAVYPPSDIDNDFRQMSVLSQLAKVLEIIQHKTIK